MSVYNRIAIVGLGLLGGSLLKRIKELCPGVDLYGVDSDPAVCKQAQNMGVDATTSIYDLSQKIDLVIIAVPNAAFSSCVKALIKHMPLDTVFTDILSVKRLAKKEYDALRVPHEFIWAHPMAGKEVSGFDNSESSLIVGKPYIVIGDQASRLIQDFSQFVEQIGARPVLMESVEVHDEVVSKISHFPYLMSSLAVPERDEILKQTMGPGFRDTTRVASSPTVWGAEVLMENRENILSDIERVERELHTIKEILLSEDKNRLTQHLEHFRQKKVFFETPPVE